MSEWMEGYRHTEKWLQRAARLEGLIEAHRILKGSDADEHDRLLWRIANEIVAETADE